MERFTLKVAVHLFLINNGNILLLRRANTGYEDGNYSVPAGHLDGGETVTAAMVRETKEETGIIVEPNNLNVVHVMHRVANDGERIDFFLTARTWVGEPVIGEPNKCDDLRWFPIVSLPSNTIPYIQFAIEQHNKTIPFSEFGWS